jgi:hypothetical protein
VKHPLGLPDVSSIETKFIFLFAKIVSLEIHRARALDLNNINYVAFSTNVSVSLY